MDQPVDEGDDAGGVGVDLPPIDEGAVRRDQGAFLLGAATDQFKQEVGMALKARGSPLRKTQSGLVARGM